MDTAPTVTSTEIQLTTPVRWFCIGPSGAGKTAFLKRLLTELDTVFDQPTNNIIYCFSSYQPLYDQIKEKCPKVIFVQGFPAYLEDQYLSDPSRHDLLILDDLIDIVSDSQLLCNAYIGNSHHKNYSVITVTQNLYYKSKYLRTCSLQCSGFIFFRCLRDQSMI